jgi:hypothetical protein
VIEFLVFIIAASVFVVIVVGPFVMPYRRAPEEKGLKPIYEVRADGLSGNMFSGIGGLGMVRFSVYDKMCVIGYTGFFSFLGQYVIPYHKVTDVQRSWRGITLLWSDGLSPRKTTIHMGKGREVIEVLREKMRIHPSKREPGK